MVKYPFVSICTPTFNRRPFFPILFEMYKLQTYLKPRMEWIIVDDGTDPIEDLVKLSGIPQIKYIRLPPPKLTLGTKRNLMHTYCKGDIIVYVDDDDYFPPERVAHSVEMLMNAPPNYLIAGSSEIYLYFADLGMYQFGPYGPNHATAGTFAFKRELLNYTKYNAESAVGEEEEFLQRGRFPMVQLDPTKTILVFPHGQNTSDKRQILDAQTEKSPYIRKSDKMVRDFIKGVNATLFIDFFTNKMHTKLEKYEAGLPKYKPEALEQIKQKNEQRKKMQELQEQQQKKTGIMMKRGDEEPHELTQLELIQLLHSQEQTINEQHKIIAEYRKNQHIL